MFVVVINGSINSGKSTIGRLAANHLAARFIEGDDHNGHELPFEQMIACAVHRLAHAIAETDEPLVIAYPLRDDDYALLRRAAETRETPLLVVTLAPPLEVALGNRGGRSLDDGERGRIREMYSEGYHNRPFSDLVVGGTPAPETIVEAIAKLVAVRPTGPRPCASAPRPG